MNGIPWTALMLGVVGSLHCIGMCGPIALALPLHTMRKPMRIAGILIYNSGRAVTYSVLGALSGLAGSALNWFGGQQVLSVTAGILILATLLLAMFGKKISLPPAFNRFYSLLRTTLGKLFGLKTMKGMFVIGLLNGMLPCGLVYAALAGAASTGSVLAGAVFMFVFGLGTIPAMFSVSFAGAHFSGAFRSKLRRAVPVFVGAMAVLLLLRGMGLDIPYLSPSHGHACCHR